MKQANKVLNILTYSKYSLDVTFILFRNGNVAEFLYEC